MFFSFIIDSVNFPGGEQPSEWNSFKFMYFINDIFKLDQDIIIEFMS